MCGGGGGGDGGAAKREQERQGRVQEGYEKIQDVFGGFGEPFFEKRGQAYIDYARPQVEDQYADAVKQLTFALARNQRLDSSVAGEQQAKLQKQYDRSLLDVAGRGADVGTQAREAVNRARTNLTSINAQIADPAQVAAQAQASQQALSAAQSFDPLAPLFTNVGETLGTQADLERRSAARYNTGVFTPSPTSGGAGSGRYIK